MAKRKKAAGGEKKRPVESYEHLDKERVNNPPVGLVTPETDPDTEEKKKQYAYDPHLDPQLVWAGKAEHTSFDVPTVSLHVHERIDPLAIIEAVRKRNGDNSAQGLLFDMAKENPPLREAIEFYQHAHGWKNRLIAGDSLLVMNSLLEKEGMAGKVQMIYIDPPYGIKYGSNFQPFVNKRDVKDGKDEDLTAEPEQIRAFRDTWELGIHSYLTYLRDRLLLARELLTESGSIFVQISDENVHHVRELMEEVFGAGKYCGEIVFRKTSGTSSSLVGTINDFLIWYCKEKAKIKYRQLFREKTLGGEGTQEYTNVELPDGRIRKLAANEQTDLAVLPKGSRVFVADPVVSAGGGKTEEQTIVFEEDGVRYKIDCGPKRHWKTTPDGMQQLWRIKRLLRTESLRLYKRYFDDFPYLPFHSMWDDTRGETQMDYVVQTSIKVIQRCVLMTTDPGDLVFDPTCGSGSTACVAEQWGRRWITCDTSRVALTLARQRLMSAGFDYYELAHLQEGVGSGFRYKSVPHVTLKSIANNPDIKEGMTQAQIDAAIGRHAPEETLYDQPFVNKKKTRVSGPFTVEAVPAPAVKSVEDVLGGTGVPPVNHGQDAHATSGADLSVARSGATLRQGEWRDELLRTGIRGKGGQYIHFSRLEPLAGCRYLHCDGQTKDEGAKRVVVSFGPEHGLLEQRQVEHALEEAEKLRPKPELIVFAAFQFDPEAAKDIDETNWPKVTLLKAQMNADLLTDDLKKKRASNESFWLIGQPDVRVETIEEGEDKGKLRVSVHGFDYYNTKTGGIESGGANQIAVWLLDTDYDGRSLYPRQVFFPMAGEKEGWARLAKSLKAEIDEELIEAYRGTVSLPFEPGEHKRVAVKIVDDRGIESLRIVEVV